MTKYQFTVESSDGESKLQAQLFMPEDKKTKKIIQIVHGITEHMGRYEEMGEILSSKFQIGTLVYDQIGHGMSVPEDKEKTIINKNGWPCLVEDVGIVREECKKLRAEIRDIPFILLGFSLGSFVVRDYLTKQPEDISKAIIAGTGWQPKCVCDVLVKVMEADGKMHDRNIQTNLTKKMLFDNYNQQFGKDARRMSWLSDQYMVVADYLRDPLTAKIVSCGYFTEMLRGMSRTCSYKAVKKILNIPILLISGDNDAVGDKTKGVETFKEQLLKTGHTDIKTIYIENARHDIFHGENQDRVISELASFSLEN